jgi:hypothetical protein
VTHGCSRIVRWPSVECVGYLNRDESHQVES